MRPRPAATSPRRSRRLTIGAPKRSAAYSVHRAGARERPRQMVGGAERAGGVAAPRSPDAGVSSDVDVGAEAALGGVFRRRRSSRPPRPRNAAARRGSRFELHRDDSAARPQTFLSRRHRAAAVLVCGMVVVAGDVSTVTAPSAATVVVGRRRRDDTQVHRFILDAV